MKMVIVYLFKGNEYNFRKGNSVRIDPAQDKTSDQPVHPPSMARILVYPSLDSPKAVEGTCDQRRF